MSEIETQFDNLSGVSDVKDFEQSQEKQLGVLDIPQLYQEFENIEDEVNRNQHSLSEVTMFSEKLSASKAVRREDALALESIVGSLESLPNIYSYTEDYSLVNYSVTQESVFSAIADFGKAVVASIGKFVMAVVDFIRNMIRKLFKKEKYINSPAKQKEVSKKVKDVKQTLEKDGSKSVKNTKGDKDAADKMSPEDKAYVNRVNKELRAYLYPHFTELQVLSIGGDINMALLIDEICIQRMKPFYTGLTKAYYERDEDVKNLIKLYTRNVSENIDRLISQTDELLSGDLSEPPTNLYARIFTLAPEQVNLYLKKYSSARVNSSNIKVEDDQSRVLVSESLNAIQSMTSISVLHDLPSPRTILNFDYDWITGLFVGDDLEKTCDVVDANFKRMKKVYDRTRSKSIDVDPITRQCINDLYSDWIVMNKMLLALTTVRARTEALLKNIASVSTVATQVAKIFER